MVLLKSFVLTGLVSLVAAKSAVLDLIPTNFDDVVLKSGKPTLVEFFAPWCGHCKTLAPVYEELATAFATSDKVQIAKVDADAEKSLGKRFGVQGFPTLKWFDGKSDKPTDYEGGRDLESLTAFIAEKTGAKGKRKVSQPSNVNMMTDATFKKEVGGDKNVLVAFTAPWCGHCKTLAPIWEALADTFESEDSIIIAKIDAEAEQSKQTAKDQGVNGYPTIKFFPKGSTKPLDYTSGRQEADFVTYLNEKVGTHRVVGGGLDAIAGTFEVLNTVVDSFTGAKVKLEEAAAEIKKEAAKLGEDAQYKYAEYYVRVFDKLAKNENFAIKELARLEGILAKGGLAPSKLDELTSKTNVLRRFVEKVVGNVEEKVKEAKEEL